MPTIAELNVRRVEVKSLVDELAGLLGIDFVSQLYNLIDEKPMTVKTEVATQWEKLRQLLSDPESQLADVAMLECLIHLSPRYLIHQKLPTVIPEAKKNIFPVDLTGCPPVSEDDDASAKRRAQYEQNRSENAQLRDQKCIAAYEHKLYLRLIKLLQSLPVTHLSLAGNNLKEFREPSTTFNDSRKSTGIIPAISELIQHSTTLQVLDLAQNDLVGMSSTVPELYQALANCNPQLRIVDFRGEEFKISDYFPTIWQARPQLALLDGKYEPSVVVGTRPRKSPSLFSLGQSEESNSVAVFIRILENSIQRTGQLSRLHPHDQLQWDQKLFNAIYGDGELSKPLSVEERLVCLKILCLNLINKGRIDDPLNANKFNLEWIQQNGASIDNDYQRLPDDKQITFLKSAIEFYEAERIHRDEKSSKFTEEYERILQPIREKQQSIEQKQACNVFVATLAHCLDDKNELHFKPSLDCHLLEAAGFQNAQIELNEASRLALLRYVVIYYCSLVKPNYSSPAEIDKRAKPLLELLKQAKATQYQLGSSTTTVTSTAASLFTPPKTLAAEDFLQLYMQAAVNQAWKDFSQNFVVGILNESYSITKVISSLSKAAKSSSISIPTLH